MKTNGNGTRHPDEILAEIERTREQMDRTLGTIEQRLTPGQLLDQGMQALKDSGAADYARNLRGSIRTHPLPVALVGVGLAWLMAADRMDRRAAPPSYDRGPESSRMGGMKEAAQEKLQGMKESLGSGRRKLDDTARMARERAARMGTRMRGSYERVVNEQPLALGAIGLALGALMAASLPRTRKEEELLSGTREKVAEKTSELVQQAGEKGHETLEEMRASTPAAR